MPPLSLKTRTNSSSREIDSEAGDAEEERETDPKNIVLIVGFFAILMGPLYIGNILSHITAARHVFTVFSYGFADMCFEDETRAARRQSARSLTAFTTPWVRAEGVVVEEDMECSISGKPDSCCPPGQLDQIPTVTDTAPKTISSLGTTKKIRAFAQRLSLSPHSNSHYARKWSGNAEELQACLLCLMFD